jgi:hypothetical protein
MSFVPSDAYIVMGHGAEPNFVKKGTSMGNPKVKATTPTIGTISNNDFVDNDSAFIVPDDCMVIVKYRPGEKAYPDLIAPFINKVGDVSKQDLFRNPLSNTKQLIQELGSVIVYKPGERCPNFLYSLYAPDDLRNDTYLSHLGLLKTPLDTPFEAKEHNDDINPDTTPITQYINTVYNESVFPTADQVLSKVLQVYNDLLQGSNLEGVPLITSYIPSLDPIGLQRFFSITQKQLLQINDDGKADRPGVYYNFVCRATRQFRHNYFINSNNLRQNVNPNVKSLRTENTRERLIIKRLIGEAEFKRKPLIRNLYAGGKRTLKKRKKYGGKKTRKNRI